jgi:type IV pilus assembly protein PilW
MTKNAHDAGQSAIFSVAGGSHGLAENDTFLAVPKGWTAADKCLLLTVTSDNANSLPLEKYQVPHVASPSASSFNAATAADWPATGFPAGSLLLNFGQLRRMVFSIDVPEVGVNEPGFVVTTWTPQGIGTAELLNSGVVLLKALYGRDTNNDGVVDTYDTTAPTDNASWQRVRAVRLVMVARSGQREKSAVTTAEPTWNVGGGAAVSYLKYPGAPTTCAANAASCALPLPISHLPDWQLYRYKVFDTAIPLRNAMWSAEE